MEVFATIQNFNFCHFFCGQCEIEEVKVLLHTIFVNRFRNDNHIILKEEMKGCLCSSFSVFFINLCQNRIGEYIVASFRKWSPCEGDILCRRIELKSQDKEVIYNEIS